MRDRLRNGRTRNVRARSRSAGGRDVAAASGAPRLHGGAVPSGHWAAADLTSSAEINAPTTAPRRLSDIWSDEHRAAARIQQGGIERSPNGPRLRCGALARLQSRGAPPTVGRRLRECGNVPRLQVLDPEAALLQERRNIPCQIQALEQPAMNRLQPQLPGLHSGIGGKPKFEEDEPAVWPQYACNPADGLQHAGDGA